MKFVIDNIQTVDLGGQQSKVLIHLMNCHKRVVTLDELIDLLNSEKANPVRQDIQNLVHKLRKNLGEQGKYIVTHPGVGYQWIQK